MQINPLLTKVCAKIRLLHFCTFLSASVSGLQQMLDVCAHNAKDLCLRFNDKKSHCIVVGPKHKCKPSCLSLSGKPLQWVESVKYLGITFMSSKVFSVDLNQLRHKFFWMHRLYFCPQFWRV